MFVVTGGGSGIGRALARALAERGNSVLIVGRHESTLIETSKSNSLIDYLCADVSTLEGRTRIQKHLQETPAINALVHNAGVIEPITPIHNIDESSWRQVLATNVDGPLFLTQLLQDKLANGRVLHIGSGAAYHPIEGWAAYCVSKAALSMLTRCWQLESDQIAFASVMPGIIDTNMQALIRHAQYMEPKKQEFFKRLKREKKLLSPETVAIFLCWLLLEIEQDRYTEQEWDIYDETHHNEWLAPPYEVPRFEE